jgi:hypothetical protein
MLFDIVTDMLAIMNECARFSGQIKGVIPHLVDGGLSILHFADDNFFSMKHDLKNKKSEINFSSIRADYLLALDHGSKSAIAVVYCHQQVDRFVM